MNKQLPLNTEKQLGESVKHPYFITLIGISSFVADVPYL